MVTNKKKSYEQHLNTLILLAYAAALILVMVHHEPWFDEAQSWLIARDATVWDLVSNITHYEGHPPIWHLLLMPLAKNHVPFEWGVKSVNFIFAVASMGVLVFKSPFPRLIRFTLPFSYFLFYQYGVISRPYSLMMLGFMLAAWFYKSRNSRPYRFTAALTLLCCSSAYGIVIVFGICLIWLYENIAPLSNDSLQAFMRSKILYSLLFLLLLNVLFLSMIYPYPNTFGTQIVQKNPFILRLAYMLFIAPADAVCTLSYFDTSINVHLNSQVITSGFLALFLNLFLIYFTRIQNKLSLFLLPYALLALFGSIVYFYTHHIGIITSFYVFLFWCCLDNAPTHIVIPSIKHTLAPRIQHKKLLRAGILTLAFAVYAIPLSWSIASSYHDLKLNYGTGREISTLIKANNLDQLRIFVSWYKTEPTEIQAAYADYNHFKGLPAMAYFDHNIFRNFNFGCNRETYLNHKIDNEGQALKELRMKGYPDILYGDVDLSFIFGSETSMRDYQLLRATYGNTIWKNRTIEYRESIFIRRDLVKDYPQLDILKNYQISGQ
jgi:hypothetical protein